MSLTPNIPRPTLQDENDSLLPPSTITSINDSITVDNIENLLPLKRTYNIVDNITLKPDIEPHLYTNIDSLNLTIFKAFICMSTQMHHTRLTDYKVKAYLDAFHAIHDKLSLENIHRHFKVNVNYVIIHPNDNNVEELEHFEPVTGKFNGLIVFVKNGIYVIKSHIKPCFNVALPNLFLCKDCGRLGQSRKTHKKHCTVIGTQLTLFDKVGERSNNPDVMRELLSVLELSEDKNTTEPVVYMKKNVPLDNSAVIVMKNVNDGLRSIFNLYYYNDKAKRQPLGRESRSVKCNEQYNVFMQRFGRVTIENLNVFFKNVTIKFYFKCFSTNRVLPCKFIRPENKHIGIAFIVNNIIFSPTCHLRRWLFISGRLSNSCPVCRRFYRNIIEHTRDCTDICKRCLNKCGTDKNATQNFVHCAKCDYYFANEKCYRLHVPKTCSKVFKCKHCNARVNKYLSSSNFKHNCESTVCRICKEDVQNTDFTHMCKIRPLKPNNNVKGCIRLYYDVECWTDKKCQNKFVSCLLSVQSACDECPALDGNDNVKDKCKHCHSISKTFVGTGCVREFINYLLELEKFYAKGVPCIYLIAQNSGRFDAWLVYSEFLKESRLLSGVPLFRNNKILLLPISRKIRAIDSLCYVPIALDKYKSAFGLKEGKSKFPHGWLTQERFYKDDNKFPSLQEFKGVKIEQREYDTMKMKYADDKGNFKVLDLLTDYCMQDVKILKLGMEKFVSKLYNRFKVHPLDGTVTMSSVAYKVFRTNYLTSDVRVIDSTSTLANNSHFQFEWLYYLRKKIDNPNHKLITYRDKLSQVYVVVAGKKYSTDGVIIDKTTKQVVTIAEALGCFHHCHLIDGNPCQLNNSKETHVYYDTMKRLKILESMFPIKFRWQCEWELFKSTDVDAMQIAEEFRESIKHSYLEVRDALYGGRTECMIRHLKAGENQEIVYQDIVSLYPSVQKENYFPTGPFFTKYGDQAPSVREFSEIIEKYPNRGVALVTLKPPLREMYPLLPVRINGILTFALCAKCAEFLMAPCTHEDEDRNITGTYTYKEIREAVKQQGYEIVEVHELLYCKAEEKVYEKCINNLAAGKVTNSGWPPEVKTEAEKDQYIENFRKQGIMLEKDQIENNPTQKLIEKQCLNAVWGRGALNKNNYKTLGICRTTKELKALYNDEGPHILEDIVNDISSENILYTYTEKKPKRANDVNVLIASLVTANARLKLLEGMQKIRRAGSETAYSDTDSLIYLAEIGAKSPLDEGWCLGMYTNEITTYFGENFIGKELVALSPKTYGIRAVHKETLAEKFMVKMKGLTQRVGDEKENFYKLLDIVYNEELQYEVPVSQFHIDSRAGDIHFRSFIKNLRDTSRKRNVLSCGIKSLPWGYIE